MRSNTKIKVIAFIFVIVILLGFTIIRNNKLNSKSPTLTDSTTSQPVSASLDPSYQLGCAKESVFIKHTFDEMNGAGYYISLPIDQNDRSMVTNDKEFLKYWNSKILATIQQYEIEKEVYDAINKYFKENDVIVEKNITKIKILTASTNYDTIELQLIQNDYFVYSVNLNYYSPI